MSDFKDHFSGQSPDYAAFRPRYPDDFIARIAALAEFKDCVWDVGTGSGQAAVPLAGVFQSVRASDASAQQIAHAAKHVRVEYRVARETDSGLPDASVDLVTVAQALHWFDLPAFYREVKRVLKPTGVLAVWTYNNAVVDDPVVQPIYQTFYEQRVGRYWPPERVHVLCGYRDLPFPFAEQPFEDMKTDALLTRDELLGYVKTWSAVKNAREIEGKDPVPELASSLAAVWPEGVRKRVTWPLHTRVGGLPS
ncbi:MAG: class I SAM-dependent methyltransferase [Gemmataceae bacterium]